MPEPQILISNDLIPTERPDIYPDAQPARVFKRKKVEEAYAKITDDIKNNAFSHKQALWWSRFGAGFLGVINGALFGLAGFAMCNTVSPALRPDLSLGSSVANLTGDIVGGVSIGLVAGVSTSVLALEDAPGIGVLSKGQTEDAKRWQRVKRAKRIAKWIFYISAAAVPLVLSVLGSGAESLPLGDVNSLEVTGEIGGSCSLLTIALQIFIERRIKKSREIIKEYKGKQRTLRQLMILDEMSEGMSEEEFKHYYDVVNKGELHKEMLASYYKSNADNPEVKRFDYAKFYQEGNKNLSKDVSEPEKEEMKKIQEEARGLITQEARNHVKFTNFLLAMTPGVPLFLSCVAIGTTLGGPVGTAVGILAGLMLWTFTAVVNFSNLEKADDERFKKLARRCDPNKEFSDQRELSDVRSWFNRNGLVISIISATAVAIATIAGAIALMANPIVPAVIVTIAICVAVVSLGAKLYRMYRTKKENRLLKRVRKLKDNFVKKHMDRKVEEFNKQHSSQPNKKDDAPSLLLQESTTKVTEAVTISGTERSRLTLASNTIVSSSPREEAISPVPTSTNKVPLPVLPPLTKSVNVSTPLTNTPSTSQTPSPVSAPIPSPSFTPKKALDEFNTIMNTKSVAGDVRPMADYMVSKLQELIELVGKKILEIGKPNTPESKSELEEWEKVANRIKAVAPSKLSKSFECIGEANRENVLGGTLKKDEAGIVCGVVVEKSLASVETTRPEMPSPREAKAEDNHSKLIRVAAE